MSPERPFGRVQQVGLSALLVCLTAWGASALEIDLPQGAVLAESHGPAPGMHPVAQGGFEEGAVATETAEGMVQRFVWQVPGADPMILLAGLRAQVLEQGFVDTFECAARDCGGFDFRHALPVGTAPAMHVDLGNFYYLAAQRETADGPETVALMVSAGGATGYVHMTMIAPLNSAPVEAEIPAPVLSSSAPTTDTLPEGDLIARLTGTGAAPLDDLLFETGASTLSDEEFASLVSLAAYLAENRDRRIVLVGHTDTVGPLATNIALSEARAVAVRGYLTERLGADPAQIEARGIGYLAPRANNTSDEGRNANRRVEVVLANPG